MDAVGAMDAGIATNAVDATAKAKPTVVPAIPSKVHDQFDNLHELKNKRSSIQCAQTITPVDHLPVQMNLPHFTLKFNGKSSTRGWDWLMLHDAMMSGEGDKLSLTRCRKNYQRASPSSRSPLMRSAFLTR